jgi:hypothetical protein
VRIGLAAASLLCLLVGCSTSTPMSLPVGAEGGPCTVGGGCDPGLICVSRLCVRPPDSALPPGNGGAGGGGRGGSTGVGGQAGTGGHGGVGGNDGSASGGAGGQLPSDGGVDAPADTRGGPDVPADRPSIDGAGTSTVCIPAGPNGQLVTQAAGLLVVAPDEKHIAFLRDPHMLDAGCIARGQELEVGTLVVLELQPDGSACQRVVANDVSQYSIYYSSDSQNLVFMEGTDGCGVGKLKAADADGSNVRLVRESARSNRGFGSTVFFSTGDQDFAAPFAGGQVIPLSRSSDDGTPVYDWNATGTAVAYRKYGDDHGVVDGSLVLVTFPSGKSQTIADGAAEFPSDRIWSPRGSWLAFRHGTTTAFPSLTLVAADGSRRIDLSANCSGYDLVFSPDDAWFVYPETDSSGGTRVVSYSLKDGKSAVLGVLPEGSFSLTFSDDSASVVATVSSASSTSSQAYAGTAGAAGSLRLLDGVPGSYGLVAAAGYVAVPGGRLMDDGHYDLWVSVYPIAGGTGVTIPGSEPRYQPGVPQPHLMVLQSSGIAIAATDGTAVNAHEIPDCCDTIPGYSYFAFTTWLGSAAVYGTTSSTVAPVSITALTNGGAVATLLADKAGAYGWSPIVAPTRIFYSRKAATDGGPAGVFYADLPR